MINYEQRQPPYLAELTSVAAVEIDELTLGKKNDLSRLNELAEILRSSLTNDVDQILFLHSSFYLPIYRAVTRESKRKFTSSTKTTELTTELELKMRLLESELEDISNGVASNDKLVNMRSFLVELSREYSSESGPSGIVMRDLIAK